MRRQTGPLAEMKASEIIVRGGMKNSPYEHASPVTRMKLETHKNVLPNKVTCQSNRPFA